MKRPVAEAAAEAADLVDARQRRSEAIAAILDNSHFREAVAALRQEATDTWRDTLPGDIAAREDAYQSLRAIDRIVRRLEAQAADGRVAAHNNRAALKRA